MGIPILGDFFKGASDIIGRFKATPEEKAKAQSMLASIYNDSAGKWLELEKTRIEQGAENVRADASSKSWLGRSWRPITMLTFVALLSSYWLGWTNSQHLTEAIVIRLLDIVYFGLGGFVFVRSAEKIVPNAVEKIAKAIENRKK